MKIFVQNSNVSFHTRHARRVYVGGIPPNYSDEEEVRNFFNKTISKGLGQDMDDSHVISVYMNQKKCYAFVEFKSIELTAACLDMDGIIFKKVTLKIYRANEYRPELVPPMKPIKLNLSNFAFGVTVANTGVNPPSHANQQQLQYQQHLAQQQQQGGPSPPSRFGAPSPPINVLQQQHHQQHQHPPPPPPPHSQQILQRAQLPVPLPPHLPQQLAPSHVPPHLPMIPHASWGKEDFPQEHVASMIEFTNIANMEKGSLVIVGFPFDTDSTNNPLQQSPKYLYRSRRQLSPSPPQQQHINSNSDDPLSSSSTSSHGGSCVMTPTVLRNCLSKYHCGSIRNPEYGLDLRQMQIMDVGDVLAGGSEEETWQLLSTTISELVVRGGVPFLVGGGRDQSYFSSMGLMRGSGGLIGVLHLSAQCDPCSIVDSEAVSVSVSDSLSSSGDSSSSHNINNRNEPDSSSRSSSHAGGAAGGNSVHRSCHGRYILFGAQGSQCSADVAQRIVDSGGSIFWLHKDLRAASTESIAVAQFSRALRSLDACMQQQQQQQHPQSSRSPQPRIMLTIDAGVLCFATHPFGRSSISSVGLTAEEVLEMVFIAGSHPNVAMIELVEFEPDLTDNSRANLLLADIFYRFALGVASRTQQPRCSVSNASTARVATNINASPSSASSSVATGAAAVSAPPTASGGGGGGRDSINYPPAPRIRTPTAVSGMAIGGGGAAAATTTAVQTGGNLSNEPHHAPPLLQQGEQFLHPNSSSHHPHAHASARHVQSWTAAPQRNDFFHVTAGSNTSNGHTTKNNSEPHASRQQIMQMYGRSASLSSVEGGSHTADRNIMRSEQQLQPHQQHDHLSIPQQHIQQNLNHNQQQELEQHGFQNSASPTPFLHAVGQPLNNHSHLNNGTAAAAIAPSAAGMEPFHLMKQLGRSSSTKSNHSSSQHSLTATPSFDFQDILSPSSAAGIPSLATNSSSSKTHSANWGIAEPNSSALGDEINHLQSQQHSTYTLDDSMDKLLGVHNIGHVPDFDDGVEED